MTSLRFATAFRLLKIREAFLSGKTIEEVFKITNIDTWFLNQIKMLSEQDYEETLYELKSKGFSDAQIGRNKRISADKVRKTRIKENILPSYKLVDTCSAEFEAKTPYCYSTYDDVNEIQPIEGKKVIILGGGPNRIGPVSYTHLTLPTTPYV